MIKKQQTTTLGRNNREYVSCRKNISSADSDGWTLMDPTGQIHQNTHVRVIPVGVLDRGAG